MSDFKQLRANILSGRYTASLPAEKVRKYTSKKKKKKTWAEQYKEEQRRLGFSD